MSHSIKELKCSTCKIKCEYKPDIIDTAIETCKNRFRTDEYACGLKKVNEMLTRLKDKNEGKPKQVPALFQPKPAISEAELDLVRKGVPEWKRKELLEGKDDTVTTVEAVSITINFAEPLRIFMAKNGHITETHVT